MLSVRTRRFIVPAKAGTIQGAGRLSRRAPLEIGGKGTQLS